MSVLPTYPFRLEPPAPQEPGYNWLDKWFNTPIVLNRGTVLAILLMGTALIPTCIEAWAKANNLSWRLKDMKKVYAREKSEFCHWLFTSYSFTNELQEQMSVSDFDTFMLSRFYAHVHAHCSKTVSYTHLTLPTN